MSTMPTNSVRLAGAMIVAGLLLALPSAGFAQREKRPPPGAYAAERQPADNALNLLPNGDFDTPSEDGTHPAHWQRVDNLVFHYVEAPDAPDRGRVMKIDTDVGQKQAYKWWIDHFIHDKPLSEAPDPKRGTRYGSIGGLDGGWYWSDYIEIDPDKAVRVYVDAKGPGAKVFVRGYEEKYPVTFADEEAAVQEVFRDARGEPKVDENGRLIRFRPRYRYQTWFAVGGTDDWRTYTHRKPRHPAGRDITEDVRYIRIMIYPYWPAATYWFDNVRVYEVDPEDNMGRPDADEADYEEGKAVR